MLTWVVFACLLAASQDMASDVPLASVEFEKGNYARACDLLEQLVAKEPASTPEVYRLLGESWMRLNEPARAADALERGLKAHPDSVVMQKALGQLLFRLNPESPRAGELLTQAAAVSPKDPEVHHYLAEWACLTNQNEVCATEARKVLATPGLNDLALLQIYTLMAMAQDQMGHAEQAEDFFRKAMGANRRLKQFDAPAALQFASFLGHLQRDEDERGILDEIVLRAPSYGPAHLEIARFLRRKEKFAQAADEAELALKLGGCKPIDIHAAHVLLAAVYWALGNKQAAEEHRRMAEIR